MLEIKGTDLIPVEFDPFAGEPHLTLPLTRQQSEVWVESQMGHEASCAFNQCFVLHLRGQLSTSSLQNALDKVLARHAALRTIFDKEGSEQRILPELTVKIGCDDLSGLEDSERQESIERIVQRETTQPFNLAEGPLIRVRLVREAADLYRLVLTVHHLVCDGWSSAVLFSDLAAAYTADRFGLAARLPKPMSYREYITSELARADAAADEAYWLEQLAGDPPSLDLPLDHKRQAARTHLGARETLRIDPILREQIKAVGASRGATLFHTLLAAFETLMYRLSGQSDLVIGIPVAGQSELENGHLVAHCVATLPLRCRINADVSFSQFLKDLRSNFLDAHAHSNVTFGSVISKLPIERDPSRPPLISILFNIDRIGAAFDFGDLTLNCVETPKRFVTFDLNVNVVDSGTELLVECDYNSDLLEPDTIRRWLGHYLRILDAMIVSPDVRVGDISLLSPGEQQQILHDWNATAVSYPASVPFTRLFEERVRLSPRSVAVSFDGEVLTYLELNARSNRLAHRLIESGARRGAVVGLCLHRSLDLLVALLAIQKSGATYLPLDPGFPAERLTYMLADSDASLLLTSGDAADGVEVPPNVTRIDLARQSPEGFSADDPVSAAGPDDPAYVIYTSGSTGRPKGVVVSHRALLNFLCSMQREPGLSSSDVLAAVTTISFDIAGLELYLPLMVGARIELVPRETAADGALLAGLLAASGATVLQATPSTWRMLIEEGWKGSGSLRALCGGEALPPDLAEALLKRVKELWNLYGPTETTIWSSVERIRPGDPVLTIGRPIANTQLYIVDKAGLPVAVGVEGEIWIGGDGVALGYHRRPELTTERFIPDCFSGRPGARLYRTGDRGRWLPDGRLLHLGRNDNQVKIRGFRIELGEIETVLNAHPMVRQSVVITREDTPGDKRLVAYVVGRDGREPHADELRRAMADVLPLHMIPAHFIALAALPLTANGKLDRRALPAPSSIQVPSEHGCAVPRTQTEEAVAAIWRQVLRSDAVDCAEDFFSLGGHSLLATQVVSRLRDAFQIELRVPVLFQRRTVQALASYIDAELREQRRAEPMPAIEPRRSPEPERLSFSQERMWLIHELAPDNRAYNIPIALQLRGHLDINAMAQAIDAVRSRHEALRTTYRFDDPFPVQIVEPWSSQPLEVTDLSQLGEGALTEAKHQAAIHAGKPFDLSCDSMMRSALFKLGEQHHLLVLTAHHIAADGWAIGLLTRDLAATYNNLRAGRPVGLDPLPIKYSDYAAWQRRWLEIESERQMAFWRERLAGVTPLELPTDKMRPQIFGFQGRLYERPFPAELRERLEQLGRREGSTLFMATLAAYVALLHRLTGQEDLTVAVPISNRNQTATEHIVGTFVNNLVIRTDLGGAPSLRELLRRVRDVALDAYAHQDAPYEALVEELVRDRDGSRPPLAQVMFNLLNVPMHGMHFDELTWQAHAIDLQAAHFEIALTIDMTTSQAFFVEYNTELFHESTIARFVDQYLRLLDAMIVSPDVRVGDISLLSPGEQQQILHDWNATAVSYPASVPFTRLFEERVRSSPRSVAVSFDGEVLTYLELNARSNRLAHRLIESGARRGAVVGLCLHRSLDLLVALLAIQKSGATYLPLDPGFPAERLTYMLADSDASLLLTSGDAADGVEVPPNVTRIDLARQSPEGFSADDPVSAAGPDDPAYVIYTSGSTGRPKGVVVSHRALLNFLCSMQREPGLSSSDVLAAVTTISFDIAGLELYLPLMVGARIELVPRETAADGALLAGLLAASGATVLQATPSTWRMLIEEGWKGSGSLRALCGGEALPPDLAEALLKRVKELWNLYGPTETTIWSSVERIRPGDPVLTIGRPIANTQLYIVDKAGLPVAVGVEGEIWIGGDGVALGYHRRPELTTERFIPDCFSGRPGARLYRTGDRGRWLPDGRLLHLGRNDNQVKIRGFRIELGEIETVLNAHPMVRQSVVITREARPGDVRILAYVVVNDGEDLTVSEVRSYLRASLPDYMIPSFVMTLQALPLTANGKLDRGALPDPFRSASDAEAVSEPPAPGMEQLLAGIWREALRVDKISAGDNFFDLGGHSLLAVRVAVSVRKQIGWRMDPRTLFFQTLRQLAAQAEVATRPHERIA